MLTLSAIVEAAGGKPPPGGPLPGGGGPLPPGGGLLPPGGDLLPPGGGLLPPGGGPLCWDKAITLGLYKIFLPLKSHWPERQWRQETTNLLSY